jgi:hypothetical protein
MDEPPGWEWESKDAQRFWEQLERYPDGTRRSIADIARELRLCGATLGEYYAASKESKDLDPAKILETMLEIRQRDAGEADFDWDEEDSDWLGYESGCESDFEDDCPDEFDDPF